MTAINKEKNIQLCEPVIENDDISEVVDTLKSGWLTSGSKVIKFENMFCDYLGAEHAVSTCSATAAWHLVAHALGIKTGDEVIVPSITWPSISNVVELLGAKTVFADVDPDTLQINPTEVRRLLTDKTKAVIPVHYAGAPCDLDQIHEVLKGTDVVLVEDAAHALGTSYKGKSIGSASAIAIFSFHPIKNITTGEGGMIVTNDDSLAARFRQLRFHGITKDAWNRYSKGGKAQFEVIEPGFKYNMTDIQAALGISQLPKLKRFNEKRSQVASLYLRLLESIEGISPLKLVDYDSVHAWHLFVVRLNLDELAISRDEFIQALSDANIGSGIHFPAIHLQQYYFEKYKISEAELPHASLAGRSIVSLPLHPGLKESDVLKVVSVIKKALVKKPS